VNADVLVVGAGPAGSVAALVLARAGARVVLADRSSFPRDKSCGDLVGPRGLQTLREVGLPEPAGLQLGDMVIVGPTGRRVRLPCFTGRTYPGRAVAVARTQLDATLRQAALDAGAEPLTGRAEAALRGDDGRIAGFCCGGVEVRAGVVIGADGATSTVAAAAGLVDASRVLWAFALRSYAEQRRPVELPYIVWWEPEPGRILPGYGWVFPAGEGRVNVGLGVGTLADRRRGAEAARRLDGFVARLHALGLLDGPRTTSGGERRRAPLGGWLKLGIVGTVPARDNVLLAGDAAGLVNPLQGEGIAQALASGKAAAEAVLAAPGCPAPRYIADLGRRYGRYQAMAAPAHRAMMERPRRAAAVTRLLTLPGVGQAVAGGWSLLWNDLVEGAPTGPARAVAGSASWLGQRAARRSETYLWISRLFAPSEGRAESEAEAGEGTEAGQGARAESEAAAGEGTEAGQAARAESEAVAGASARAESTP